MKTISIVNQKGGIGKTTTAVNLSASFALDGYKTLLVDMDKQRSATKLVCGEDIDGGYIGDVLMRRSKMSDVILETRTKNLDIAPSRQRLDGDNIDLLTAVYKEFRLLEGLKSVADNYDFAILDNPPDLNSLSINTIAACDVILIPCMPGMLALEGLMDLFHTIREVRGIDFEYIRIFLNGYHDKLVGKWSAKELDGYQGWLMRTKLRSYTAYEQAQILRTSICEFDQKSNAAKNFMEFKEEILEYVKDI